MTTSASQNLPSLRCRSASQAVVAQAPAGDSPLPPSRLGLLASLGGARSGFAGRSRKIALACAAGLAVVCAPLAEAYACSATQTEVYRSAKSVWCVEKSIVKAHGAFPTSFFPYGDEVVDELVFLFKVPAEGVYTFEASVESGGAHTGSECCGLGVTVTGDAFYNNAYGAKGFWGYLLALHEMINDFTGQVTGGWPTDFWADHISAFPNSMDWHIMDTLGKKNNDQNLIKSAAAQKKRFYPGGDSVDPRVGMFDDIFDLPNYGFDGLSRVFGYVEADKLSWDNLGVPNPDVKRTEYVIAYLSLGAGKPVTPIMKAAHVGDGTPSGAGDPGYDVNDDHIDAIANAHCAITAAEAQGVNVSKDRKSFQAGKYADVKVQGKCGTGCADECGCKSDVDLCVAAWNADPKGGGEPDSGGGSSGDDDDGGSIGGGNQGGDGGSIGGGGSGVDGGKGSGGNGPGAGSPGNGADGDTGASGGCNVGGTSSSSLFAMVVAAALAALAILRVRAPRR